MLTLRDSIWSGRHWQRRDFLRVGTMALAGLPFATAPAWRALSSLPPGAVRDRSVIFLFMHGGPSQFETFDPKMEAPSDIRSATGESKTPLAGITFGGSLPKLARLADKVSIVRSFVTGDGNHDIKPIVGRDTLRANLGALYARVAGPIRPHTAMPSNVALFPRAVDAAAGPAITEFGDFLAAGEFGAAYAPFVPGAGSGLQSDMKLNLPQERLHDRTALLAAVNRWQRSLDREEVQGGLTGLQRQALTVLQRGVADAFDLSQEEPYWLDRYDTSRLVPREKISTKWNNVKHYGDHASSIGKLLLLARRLCERGCGFVTVTTSFVWDMHADINNAPMAEGMGYVGTPFDHAVSALVEDLESRGLRDKVLLVCCGEMGRTPRLNKDGGRDHWGNLAPLLLYGGGLQMGQVIGRSTRDGGEPASDPVMIKDLIATLMHVLLDPGQVRLMPDLSPALMQAITAGTPIRGLI